MLQHLNYPGPLGPMLVTASASGITGIWFREDPHLRPQDTHSPPADLAHPTALVHHLQEACHWLSQYFDTQRPPPELPAAMKLDISLGTPFEQEVWQALCTIAPGQTRSYSDIAQMIDRPRAVRAVGAAIGRNPLSILIPCHRVLGKNGALTGYAGGLPRKKALLEREGVLT
jgi:methylated-DNA-[protein]-cysteine S-methyltransferase